MNATMKTLSALFLAAFAAASNADTRWASNSILAYAPPNDGIIVGVAFPSASMCERALFAVWGNDDIEQVILLVDGNIAQSGAAMLQADENIQSRYIELTEATLNAIKGGHDLLVMTEQGHVVIKLDGSSAAIDAALRACEQDSAKLARGQ